MPALAPIAGAPIAGVAPLFAIPLFLSGSNSTVLGSISSGTNVLIVSSVSGWSAGMGIAIAGAGQGGTELITSVTQVYGSTIIILKDPAVTSVTNAIVNHDDTAAISTAISASISSGLPIFLPNGNYNFTGDFTQISSPVSIRGQDIYYTNLINRSASANPFKISYSTLSPWPTIKKSCVIGNFQISQDPLVTPTSGGMFTIGATNGLTTGIRLKDIVFNGMWEGLHVNGGQISNWFERLYFRNLVGGNAIVYNSPGPNGDCHFNDIECSGYNTGIEIRRSDTIEFSNLKTNFSGVRFVAQSSNADIIRVRFINPSIEGDFNTAPSAGFDFGTYGATQVSIIGGGIGIMPKAFNNLHLNSGGYVLTNVYDTADPFSGWVQYGAVTQITG